MKNNNFFDDLEQSIGGVAAENIFILTDCNTEKFCLPYLLKYSKLSASKIIVIPGGDENKTIENAACVWKFLSENGATRHSLMLNLGGGMITDIGGFCAATFKRGMNYINLPTTLLGAVDAATGGKTGVNFLGLKNEIGVFAPPQKTLFCVEFFKTLDAKNLLSGYAEMLKHALLSNKELWRETLNFDLENTDFEQLSVLLIKNVAIKENIVAQDPQERGLRKALNLGHTFGHAFETFSYRTARPLLHGYAVLFVLICELYISVVKLNFPKEELLKIRYLAKEHYGSFDFSCENYEAFYNLMTHDKKNETAEINFTLLSAIGDIHINQTATKNEIFECLDYLREG
ncbi:MAG: 3-dehydroquinate synthase [Paludibacter sp.]|nr:3-dehydroquinate synthase [Paludibacter sp.]